MNRNTTHRITVCTACRDPETGQSPGYDLIRRLRAALDGAGDRLSGEYTVAGAACMAGCARPCTVAYHGTGKATYLFGDMDPAQDIADLVDFARQYAVLHDGWCTSFDRPGKLRKSTLARVPATLFSVEPCPETAA